MATIITSECINCGACEPECPNTAIYAGAVEWEMGGESHPAIAQDIYYIVASKCTECVGFYDHEACAAVCPVDCCVPDPNNLESEQVLIERAQVLHPEQSFGADFPSRFRKEGVAAADGQAVGDGVAADTPAAVGDGALAVAANGPVPAAVAKAAPAPAAKPAPATAPAATAVPVTAAAQSGEFDPASWEVPIVCKDCRAGYSIPYRHFQVGVVFYCSQCSGSFVPNSTLYRQVKETFEGFYGRRRREREAFERRQARELAAFEERQTQELAAFKNTLHTMAEQMKPAGKLVRPKGLAAMFS